MGIRASQLSLDSVLFDILASGALTLKTTGIGAGLSGGAGSGLAIDLATSNPGLEFSSNKIQVKVDNSSIERAASGIQLKDGGVTKSHINSSAIGAGLTGGSGSSLAIDYTASHDFSGSSAFSVPTPTQTAHAVTKGYVDGLVQGLDAKDACRAGTTANITLSGTQTIDGVDVVAGDRVLVKNQTDPSENGIYVAAAGAWSRASDANADDDVTQGLYTFVAEGTANGGNGWVLTTADPIVLDTTELSFAQFSGAGQVVAGTGLTQSGNTINAIGGAGLTANADSLDVNVDNSSIEISGDNLRVKASGITNDMLAGSIANAKLSNSSVTVTAGDGLKTGGAVALGSSVTLDIDVSDFAGTGLEDDGSENLRIASSAAGNGLTGGSGSALSVAVRENYGLLVDENNLYIDLHATTPGLEFGGGKLKAKIKANSGLNLDSDGLWADVDGTTLELHSGGIRIVDGGVGFQKLHNSISGTWANVLGMVGGFAFSEVNYDALGGKVLQLSGPGWSDLNIAAQGTPNMTVKTSLGGRVINQLGQSISVVSQPSITISAAHATNDRRDVVVVDTQGLCQVRKGAEDGSEAWANIAIGDVILAEVFVGANAVEIVTGNITDYRQKPIGGHIIQQASIGGGKMQSTAFGNGFTLVGDTWDLVLDGGTLTNSSSGLKVTPGSLNNVQFHSDVAGNGLEFSGNGIQVAFDAAQMEFDTGLLSIKAQGITATELHTSVAGAGLAGGGGSALSVNCGSGLEINGDNVQLDIKADSGLEFSGGEIAAKVNAAKSMSMGADGLAVEVDGVTLEHSANKIQVKDASLGLGKMGWAPVQKVETGDGVATSITLADSINAAFKWGVKVFWNGVLQKQVAADPAGGTYTVSGTTVSFGSWALPNNDEFLVHYLA
jgi:hypothetical protein